MSIVFEPIVVPFHFHRSAGYSLVQQAAHHDRPHGVFAICVGNLDMIDGTTRLRSVHEAPATKNRGHVLISD